MTNETGNAQCGYCKHLKANTLFYKEAVIDGKVVMEPTNFADMKRLVISNAIKCAIRAAAWEKMLAEVTEGNTSSIIFKPASDGQIFVLKLPCKQFEQFGGSPAESAPAPQSICSDPTSDDEYVGYAANLPGTYGF
ncbi:MAG: hypothetical protein H7230_01345 [Candidatus Parcubacteria bacterium]|nr:hypothetical protein [Candidatus Paceibacterota bacterium]